MINCGQWSGYIVPVTFIFSLEIFWREPWKYFGGNFGNIFAENLEIFWRELRKYFGGSFGNILAGTLEIF